MHAPKMITNWWCSVFAAERKKKRTPPEHNTREEPVLSALIAINKKKKKWNKNWMGEESVLISTYFKTIPSAHAFPFLTNTIWFTFLNAGKLLQWHIQYEIWPLIYAKKQSKIFFSSDPIIHILHRILFRKCLGFFDSPHWKLVNKFVRSIQLLIPLDPCSLAPRYRSLKLLL